MSLVYIISNNGNVALDVTSSAGAEYVNEVTEYPIESGFSVTKGVISKSDVFNVTGIISDYHIKNSSENRSDEVVKLIKNIKDNRELVTLVVKTDVTANLVITNFNVSETSTTGFGKQVTLNFKQVRVASSTSTTVPREARPEVEDKTDEKVNNGAKPKEELTTLRRAIFGAEDLKEELNAK